jgi:hypothetical protein
MGVNLFEQGDHGSRRELDTGHAIEPNARAGKAQVHIHGAPIVSLERLRLHGRAAAGTGNGVRTEIGHICNLYTKAGAE